MNAKWKFFFGAAALAAYFLIAQGVPVVPVLTGCSVAALLTWGMLTRQARQTAQGR
jgi:hypothetical protein